MAQTINLQIQGEKTNPNPLQVGDGTLKVADNVVVDAPNVASSRRGFARWGNRVTTGGERINSFVNYDGNILLTYGSTLTRDTGAGVWSDYAGTVNPPDASTRSHYVVQNGNLYITTDEGVKKLDGVGSTISIAGMMRGLGADWSLAGATGFLGQEQVAYRIVWGIKDGNDNVILGPPSQRIEAIGPVAGTNNVTLVVYIPAGVTVNHFFQIYRSAVSASLSDVANDELGLVYEANPVAGDLTAGYVTVTDSTPDSLRGATIYTAPSQEGILQENERPPLCKDMALYKDMVVYANTETRHRLFITLLGSGGTSGVQVNDVITVGGVAYTGKAAETVASAQFKVFDTGNPGDDDQNTALSLCKVINGYSGNTTVYAYYISAYNDLPGKMLIEARAYSAPFTMAASANGSAWSPSLATTQSSDNEAKANRIYISKNAQPESVPILNYVDVGSDQGEILRVIGLRDSLFAFTSEGQAWKISGETISDLTVNLFDSNVNLKGRETVAVVNNQVFLYTVQGVQSVNDSGAGVASWDNDSLFQQFSSATVYPTFENDAFGVGYDNDRKYLLYNGESIYVYNVFTKAWTRWRLQFTAGFVNTDNKLYFGETTGRVYQERKDLTALDFADDALPVTIVSAVDNVVTLTSGSMASVTVGWSLAQGTRYGLITAKDTTANTVTLNSLRPWMAGAATVNEPILCEVEWNPIHAGNPGIKKQFTDIQPMFRNLTAGNVRMTFVSNYSLAAEYVDISPLASGYTYNTTTYNTIPFGGIAFDSTALRTLFPLEKQVALWERVKISTYQAFTQFQLLGISIQYVPMDWGFK